MSKRFGRNQKRKLLQAVAAAEYNQHVAVRALVEEQREIAVTLENLARMFNNYHPGLKRRTLTLSEEMYLNGLRNIRVTDKNIHHALDLLEVTVVPDAARNAMIARVHVGDTTKVCYAINSVDAIRMSLPELSKYVANALLDFLIKSKQNRM